MIDYPADNAALRDLFDPNLPNSKRIVAVHLHLSRFNLLEAQITAQKWKEDPYNGKIFYTLHERLRVSEVALRNAMEEFPEIKDYEVGKGLSNLITEALELQIKNLDRIPRPADWPRRWDEGGQE